MTNIYVYIKAKCILLSILLAFFACSLQANNYYVTTVADTGAGSLRASIDSTNLNPGLDTITLQLSVQDTIYLSGPLPAITDSLLVTGLPCQNPYISGGLVPFNGSAFHSGGLINPLTLNYLNVINCLDTASNAQGAAAWARQLSANNCYFSGNVVKPRIGNGKGGAVYADHVWIYNCTFYMNTASNKTNSDGLGGALNSSSRAYMYNCTFAANNSAGPGGAMVLDSAVISNCTFTNNSAGTQGGALGSSDSITISNSIIWNNTAISYPGLYIAGPVNSGGCNVLQTSSDNYNFATGPSDISGTDPMLDTLGYFSGCVPVIPIFCGSVAQNLASCIGATDSDAEGLPAYGVRDAGAFEITPPSLGGDTIDSIQPGTTADLVDLFNTTGLTFFFTGNYTDSTQVDTGTYTIIATNYLGCSDTAIAIIRYGIIDTTIDTIMGIMRINTTPTGFSLFPNPASGLVNISFKNFPAGKVQLVLLDETGRQLGTQLFEPANGTCHFDVSGLSGGLYYVQITDSSGTRIASKLNII